MRTIGLQPNVNIGKYTIRYKTKTMINHSKPYETRQIIYKNYPNTVLTLIPTIKHGHNI